MKSIIDGKRKNIKHDEVKWIYVPLYDELKPENVLLALDFKKKYKDTYKLLLNFCPEIEKKGRL